MHRPARPKTIDKIVQKLEEISGEKKLLLEMLEKLKQEVHGLQTALSSINLGVAGGTLPDEESLDGSNLLMFSESVSERLVMLGEKFTEYGEI